MTTLASANCEQELVQPGASSQERRVLFVDDEQQILDGLRRRFCLHDPGWQMAFESDPRNALSMLEHEHFDALVTDMRMPNVDGAELLSHAIAVKPEMLRIVLSGQSERGASIRAAALAHQVLAKPSDTQEIRRALTRFFRLSELVADETLRKTIGGLSALPVSSEHHEALRRELGRTTASAERIGAIVEQDLAMTAKVLQLANSALFAQRAGVTCVRRAVACLGQDVMAALTASESTFDSVDGGALQPADVGNHHLLTAILAARIAEMAAADSAAIADAWQAGMLHDIGMLILRTQLPEESAAVSMLHDLHGAVGGYLIALWGFPDSIVDAVAYHHHPRDCPNQPSSALTAVHVANALFREHTAAGVSDEGLDIAYLRELGVGDSVTAWRAEAARFLGLRRETERGKERSYGGCPPVA